LGEPVDLPKFQEEKKAFPMKMHRECLWLPLNTKALEATLPMRQSFPLKCKKKSFLIDKKLEIFGGNEK